MGGGQRLFFGQRVVIVQCKRPCQAVPPNAAWRSIWTKSLLCCKYLQSDLASLSVKAADTKYLSLKWGDYGHEPDLVAGALTHINMTY